MPWTAALFALGALAVSGLPPLNGFVGEWLVYLGLFDAVGTRSPAAWAAAPAAILLGTAGALALATFVKAGATTFLGAPRTPAARHAHECGPWMRGPMLALAAGCLALGLAPVLVWPALARAIAVWHPAWVAEVAPAPLVALSPAPVVFAIAAVAAVGVLWRRSHRHELRRGPTWDCGYAAPTARMQYSGGSFGATATAWFGWLLRPAREVRRPRGYFPTKASVHERTPEPVLERVAVPAGGAILQASAFVRRLQHGRLQFYLVYLAAGLAALGLLVWLGGNP
jgi:hydrogenase-4 component B